MKFKKPITATTSVLIMLFLVMGCTSAISPPVTAGDATASPASMDGKTIEEQVLESMGLSYPFDYSDKQEAIEAGMVVAFDTKEMINAEAVNDFIIALHKNEPCSLIIVKYDDEDALKHVYVLIQQNPELVCESIGNGTRGRYTFNDVTIEDGFVCGTFGSAKSKLAANKPVMPIDLTEQLNALTNAKGTLSYPVGPELGESLETKTLKIEMTPLIKLLTADPIYFFCEADAIEQGIDIRVKTDDLLLALNADGSIFINYENTLYTSFSTTLYSRMFTLTGIDDFHSDSVQKVEAITIERKVNGKIQTVEIDDEQTMHTIAGLLLNAALISPCPYYRNPDIRMTLHTSDGDIVCTLHSSPDTDAHYHEGEYMVNRYLMFESQEFLDYVRSLLE